MGRFTIVALFERFVQQFVVEERPDPEAPDYAGDWGPYTVQFLVHSECGEAVCSIDADDTLGDLLVTANNHEC